MLFPWDQEIGKDTHFHTLIQHSGSSSNLCNKARKRNKTVPIFTDDMIVYMENPKESTKKTPRTSEFSKVAEYKSIMQNSQL